MPLFQFIAQRIPGTEARASFKAGAVAQPAMPDIESQWLSSLLGAASSAGINVNEKVAMGVSTVYASVNLLANTVATLPCNIHRRLEGGLGSEVATDHPLYSILHDSPHDEMTSVDFRRAVQANLSLHQNGYAIIVRNGFNDISALIPRQEKDVEPVRVGGELKYIIDGSYLDASQVIHLRGTSFNGILPDSLTDTARDSIGLAAALDKNAGYFFKNGSFPGGFLEIDGSLSPEARRNLEASFQAGTGGENASKVKLLEEGLKWREGRSKNNESQFDESRDRQAKDIARFFSVPGHKVGIIGNQPRANVEQENISFVTDTIRPILVTWEQAMNQKLLTPEERKTYFIKFNIAGLLRGDLKTRFEAYNIARNGGWMNVNEIRALEDQSNIGAAGDIYLQPLNMADSANNPPANND